MSRIKCCEISRQFRLSEIERPAAVCYKKNIEALHAKVGADSARFAKEAAALIEAEIKQFANNTRMLFDKALYAARMFSLIMLIYSIMVLLKTYGIVLARIIFDTSNTRKFHARLSNEETDPERFNDDTPVNSNVVLLEQPHDLLRKDRHDYFFTRDVSLPAGLPMAWIPYPAKSIRSRIRPQRYLMSYADVTKGKFPIVSLQLPPTIELVRWKIAKRERVVFRWQDLVGWSKGVRVSTQISFSLQALVFGRAVFHTAEGPGILFLRTRGDPIIGDSAAARQPRDAACLISWHTRTPFEVHSQLNLQGVFLRGYNIEKQAMGLVIYSSHSESGGSAILGIGRWLRTFLSPI